MEFTWFEKIDTAGKTAPAGIFGVRNFNLNKIQKRSCICEVNQRFHIIYAK